MKDAERGRRRPDLGLPLLLLFVCALNLAYLDPRILPLHDTFYHFQTFYVFYNHFFFEHDLARWYPYGVFGVPADLMQVIALTPVEYLLGLAGALLGVQDAMLLFKLSVIGEQMVFVAGCYLLARQLFAARWTPLAVGVAAAGTVVWYAQLWFELHFFYLLPLVLFCFLRFLHGGRPAWLWLAGVASVAWSMGNVPYFVPLWALVLLIVGAGPALARRGRWARLLELSAGNLLTLGVFVVGAAVYSYFAFHALEFVALHEEGRNLATGDVDLETFRTWGGNADLATVARSLLFGWPVQLPWGSGVDNSLYIGLLPLVGLGVAVLRERAGLFLGLAAAIAVLVGLSLGGVFATLIYQLPSFSQFRHVGLVYGLVKALLILAAGYGLDRLWRRPIRPPAKAVTATFAALAAVGFAVLAARLPGELGGAEGVSAGSQLLLRSWLYLTLGLLGLALARSLAAGLLVALALDLAIYQAAVYRQIPELPASYEAKLDAFRVHPIQYQPQRHRSPEDAGPGAETERRRSALDLSKRPGAKEVYWTSYDFAQFDPCRSQYWTDMWTRGVDNLLIVEREGVVQLGPIVACDRPKLRVVSGPRVVRSVDAAAQVLVHPPDSPVRDVIRLLAGGSVPPQALRGVASADAGSAEVERFTLNELEARVRVGAPGGAWLIYTDCFYPGWRATVDGREVSISEANLAFKAIWVPEGDRRVRFWFEPQPSHTLSYALALFGLGCGLGLLALIAAAPFGLRPARRSPDGPG